MTFQFDDEAKTHSLRRTSPMGKPFIGTCIQCGIANLSSSAALEPCDNVRGLTQSEALLEVLDENVAEEQP